MLPPTLPASMLRRPPAGTSMLLRRLLAPRLLYPLLLYCCKIRCSVRPPAGSGVGAVELQRVVMVRAVLEIRNEQCA